MTYSFFDGLNVYRDLELKQVCDITGYDYAKCYGTIISRVSKNYMRYKNIIIIKGSGGNKKEFIDAIPKLYRYYAKSKSGEFLIGSFEYIADHLLEEARYGLLYQLKTRNIIIKDWTIYRKGNNKTVDLARKEFVFKSICDGYDIFKDVTKKEFSELSGLSILGIDYNIRLKKRFICDFVVSYDEYLNKEQFFEYTKNNSKFYAVNGNDFITGKLNKMNKWINEKMVYQTFYNICNRNKKSVFGDWELFNNIYEESK